MLIDQSKKTTGFGDIVLSWDNAMAIGTSSFYMHVRMWLWPCFSLANVQIQLHLNGRRF